MGFWDNVSDYANRLQPLANQLSDYQYNQTQNDVFAANPEFAEKLYGAKNADRDSALKKYAIDAQLQTGLGAPSNVREYQYYNSLTPEQQQEYLRVKRAQQNLDLGGSYGAVDPVTGGVRPLANKTLAPADQPLNAAAKAGAQEQATQDVRIQTAGPIAENTARGSAQGKAIGEVEGAKGKKEANAPDIISLIDEAKKILPQATSGGGEKALKAGAQFLGVSTDASKADRRLKIIGTRLTNYVPRFEGPQSDADVATYKDAAGDVANESLPYEDRLAALDTIDSLEKKYIKGPIVNQSPSIGNQNSPSRDDVLKELARRGVKID